MKRTAIDLDDMPPIKIGCSKERLANRLANVVLGWLKNQKSADVDLVRESSRTKPSASIND